MNWLDGINLFFDEIWKLFVLFNGNSGYIYGSYTSGIKFSTGLIFSVYLFLVIKMRAVETLRKEHIIAMVGALLLTIRYATLLVFEWGFQINLYSDIRLYYTYPALDQFFFMMGIGCLMYYSLHHYNYYPGLLKKILWYIPIIAISVFIINIVQWSQYFNHSITHNLTIEHKFCFINWKTHVIIWIASVYMISVAIYKKKIKECINVFWFLLLLEESFKLFYIYNHFVLDNDYYKIIPSIYNSFQIISLPILALHFTKTYSKQIQFCLHCQRYFRNV